MSEQNKQQVGDGQDNYGGAAKNLAKAVKSASVQQGAQSTAAAAAVKAGTAGGSAVANVAVGTAAGGPWGAIIAAAWSLRHTIFKILICIALLLLFFIVAIASLPSIVFNNVFQTDPSSVWSADQTVFEISDDLSSLVADCVQAGLDDAMLRVENIIADGGYDYDASMDALIDYGSTSMDYDLCYILAAYSISMNQVGTTATDLRTKLTSVTADMFQVTYTVESFQREIPSTSTDDTDSETPATPEYETVYYAICTIHPFDQSVMTTACGFDPDATYGGFNITCGEAVTYMASSLKMTLYGSLTGGEVPPLTDAELIAIVDGLSCSETRKELIRTALSLVGRVPYFWGGKSAPGWNDAWNTPKVVTSPGSTSSGTIRPYGLDCSGFVTWVYATALGHDVGDGSDAQYFNNTEITEDELLPGDMGFKADDDGYGTDHVLLYVGEDDSGNQLWVHCASGTGVVLNSPNYVVYYSRASGIDLESDVLPTASIE